MFIRKGLSYADGTELLRLEIPRGCFRVSGLGFRVPSFKPRPKPTRYQLTKALREDKLSRAWRVKSKHRVNCISADTSMFSELWSSRVYPKGFRAWGKGCAEP